MSQLQERKLTLADFAKKVHIVCALKLLLPLQTRTAKEHTRTVWHHY